MLNKWHLFVEWDISYLTVTEMVVSLMLINVIHWLEKFLILNIVYIKVW